MKSFANNNRAMKSTWSDSDDEPQSTRKHFALISSFHEDELDVDLESSNDEDDLVSYEANDMYTKLYNATMKVQRENDQLKSSLEKARKDKRKLEVSLETCQHQWDIERTNLIGKLQDEASLHVTQGDGGEKDDQIRTLQVELKGQILLNVELTCENEKLQAEVMKAHERFEKFEASSNKVSKMISFGKSHNNKEGLGFGGKSTKQTIFVKEGSTKDYDEASVLDVNRNKSFAEVVPQRVISSLPQDTQVRFDDVILEHQPRYGTNSSSFVPTCFQCGKMGHIRPRCNMYRKESNMLSGSSTTNSNDILNAKMDQQMDLMNKIAEMISIPEKLERKSNFAWIKSDEYKCAFENSSNESLETIDEICLFSTYRIFEEDDLSEKPMCDPPPIMRTGFNQVQKNHSVEDIIGDVNAGIRTRRHVASEVSNDPALVCLVIENVLNKSIVCHCDSVSLIEPQTVKETLVDDKLINVMLVDESLRSTFEVCSKY